MFAVVGVVAALIVIGAVIGIMYFAGNRGRSQEAETREAAAKGNHQKGVVKPARAEGRGDL